MTTRRTLLQSLSLLPLLGLASTAALAEKPWPADRPIKMIVAGSPGSGTDIFSRFFSEQLSRALGQSIIIENKAGANGIIAIDAAAKSKGDGYTFLFAYAAAIAVNPTLQPKLPYDIHKDIIPVAQIGGGGNYLVVASDVPATDIKSYVAWAKPQGDKLNYGSWGIGSGGHLSMEALKMMAGLQTNHVPYKTTPQVLNDMQAGIIKVAFADTNTTLPLYKAGKVKVLAITGTRRAPQTPEVTTMTEQGYKFDTDSWYGIFAPAGTPMDFVKRVNAEVVKILSSPEMKQRLLTMNMGEPILKTQEEFAATVQRDIKTWGEIIRVNNIKPE